VRCRWIGYQSVLASPVTFLDVASGTNIGQRNATYNVTESPYKHFGSTPQCTPTSSTQCCVYADARYRYDYW
jgi:hypothetical protein